MKHLLLASLALLVLAPAVRIQSQEQGSPAELRGLTKIYIDEQMNRKDRERMLKVFEKNARKLPGVEVVDAPGDADVWLLYRVSSVGGFGRRNREPDSDGLEVPTGSNYHARVYAYGSVVAVDKPGAGAH